MIHHLKILQTMASKVKWIKLKAYLAMLLASGSSFTYYQNCSIHGWGLNLKLKCSFQGPNLVSKPWCLLQGLLHESGSKCLLRGPNFSLGLSFILDSHFLLHFPQQSALEWEAKSIPVKKIGWYCWFSDLNNTIDINSCNNVKQCLPRMQGFNVFWEFLAEGPQWLQELHWTPSSS